MQGELHILFVDDNPGDRALARETIEESCPTTQMHTACDGEAALSFLRREGVHSNAPRPHLIILDFNMPRMDGIETLRVIKADHDLKAIPVIIFSSSTAPTDLYLAYGLQANAYVIKPSELEDFMRVIRQIELFWSKVATVMH